MFCRINYLSNNAYTTDIPTPVKHTQSNYFPSLSQLPGPSRHFFNIKDVGTDRVFPPGVEVISSSPLLLRRILLGSVREQDNTVHEVGDVRIAILILSILSQMHHLTAKAATSAESHLKISDKK